MSSSLRGTPECGTRDNLIACATENLDWKNRIIFVPDSKTADARTARQYQHPELEMVSYRSESSEWIYSAEERVGKSMARFGTQVKS
jgi:hypothetical protein